MWIARRLAVARGASPSSALLCLLAMGTLGCGSTSDDDPTVPAGVAVHVRATTETFPHGDGLAGITPRSAAGGVRSLTLLRSDGDPAPLELFHLGATSKEVGYSHGDDTRVTVLDPAVFVLGTYTLARMVQSHSRYEIDATFHEAGEATRGRLENLIVLSDGTRVDGGLRDTGYFRNVFHVGKHREEVTGDDAVVAPYSFTAGAKAVVEDGEWAVYFPIQLEVTTPPVAGDRLVLRVNLFEAFRWRDSDSPGYVDGEFDFSRDAYEEVVRFGGNRFDLGWE